jgi:hypothetical protein
MLNLMWNAFRNRTKALLWSNTQLYLFLQLICIMDMWRNTRLLQQPSPRLITPVARRRRLPHFQVSWYGECDSDNMTDMITF